jgi:hypothetical protein
MTQMGTSGNSLDSPQIQHPPGSPLVPLQRGVPLYDLTSESKRPDTRVVVIDGINHARRVAFVEPSGWEEQ